MRIVRLVVLFALCLPNVLASWLILLLVRALWGKAMRMQNGVLIVTLAEKSWPMRTWWRKWAGFCAGHAIMLAPDQDVVVPHELEHTIQVQVNSIAHIVPALAIGLAIHWSLGLVYLLLAPLLQYVAAMLVALLYGQQAYRDNIYERAARDATKV
jgi:hypothetical protein